ncbi:erythromycin esterase family protein [Pontimicrobium aquaticum]|uniref:Erythromycin esterase family protein n=1 Tax=Pontimicrobium aquaticum TaxID=2565367 RepID=A0A4V5LR78_9FLAO|nr:erythromycin esterase family protein [Pontimicrobium aquaticum]TJY38219.1 erythromycin esterase family protein [Pontimicrobium aquaticum]
MFKHVKLLSKIKLSFLIYLTYIGISIGQDLKNPEKWLTNNVFEITDLEYSQSKIKQFQYLKKAIGNRNVVLLGEQTHGDGSTFEAKELLIKYLHEELGFKILVFESSIYQSYKLWNELEKGVDYKNIIEYGINDRWSNIEQVQPIFSYVQKSLQTNNPLKMVGMDVMFDGSYSKEYLLYDFENFLKETHPKLFKHKNYTFFKYFVNKSIKNKKFLPSKFEHDKFLAILEVYLLEFEKHSANNFHWNSSGFWKQVWKSYKMHSINKWSRLNGTYSRYLFFNRRSKMMAENLEWITRENKKVIVWAATNHNMRNVDSTFLNQMGWSSKTKFMGEYLSNLIGSDKMFHIAFTGHDGSFLDIYNNSVKRLKKPSPKSIESLLYSKEFDYAYFMLNDINNSKSTFFKNPFKASFVFNKEYLVKWNQSIDAVFYIKSMKPAIRIKNK